MRPDDSTAAATLATLAADLQRESPASTVDLVVRRVTEVIPDVDFASVTLSHGGRLSTVGATDQRAEEADALQYEYDEGPCVRSAKREEWYRSGDVARDERWPRWGPKAAVVGVGSLLSVPLLSKDDPTGALNLYASETGAFADREEIEFATLYATHVAVALSSSRQADELRSAVHARHTIGMAQGVLIERFGLTPDQSFALLRRYSNNLNRKLHDVAEELLGTGKLPDLPG